MIDYDPHSWRSHLFDIKGSMAREIIVRVMAFTLWAAIVVVTYHLVVPDKEEFQWSPHHTVHSLVGLALGLLLVFRTNASYDRFWEGRKLWGGIVNETRNLARLAMVHLPADVELRDKIIRWTASFPFCCMYVLRKNVRKRPDLVAPVAPVVAPVAAIVKPVVGPMVAVLLEQKVHRVAVELPPCENGELGPAANHLPRDARQQVLAADHLPTAVARQITGLLREARDRGMINDFVMVNIDQNTQLLVDYIGGCERIHKTPIPFAYMVHVRRALILYCIFLPLALVGEFNWLTIPISFIVAYVFIGIEEIGVEIEDPFGYDDNDLPLEAICATIERNLLDMIQQPPVKPEMVEGS